VVPSAAQEQACCDLISKNRTCFDDQIGKGSFCPSERSLGDGTSCAGQCLCDTVCNSCVSKASGDNAQFEVQLVSTSFNGTDTTFTYRVCTLPTSAFELRHWVLELTPACCGRFVSAAGGTFNDLACDPTDPEVYDIETGLAGVLWEVAGVPTCVGTCGVAGAIFTVTLSGNVGTGCTRAGNHSGGGETSVAAGEAEVNSTACLAGPSCNGTSACCDHAQPGGVCTDNIDEATCFAISEQPEFFNDLTCAEVEMLGYCEEHRGACCDHEQPGGTCVDDVAESACIGDQAEFFKGMLCADVEALGLCAEHTGACCDASQPGGVCTDGVPGSQCVGSQQTFFKGLNCSDVEPNGCTEHLGACCDHAQPGGVCVDGIAGSVCTTTMGFEQPEFFKDETCAQVEAGGFCAEHTGACCDHSEPGGVCTDAMTESACLAGDGQPEFFKGLLCADVELYGLCAEHTGACCDHATSGGTCVDDVAESVCMAGTGQPEFFKGATCATVESIGRCNEHIGACCDRRISDPLLRCRSDVPESQCVIDDPSQVAWYKGVRCEDLVPGCLEHTGSCCDGTTGSCQDGVVPGNCVGDQQVWQKDTLCADLNPECAQHRGACCDTTTGMCVNDVLPGACAGPGEVWSKGLTCGQVTCAVSLGACCDASTFGTCTETTQAQCTCPMCTWYPGQDCTGIMCIHTSIPAVSHWGLVVLALVLVTGAKVFFGRNRAPENA
jgi:hypothetical protein